MFKVKCMLIKTLSLSGLLFLAVTASDTARRPQRTPDIHYVPTPHEVVEIMLRLADVQEDDVVYDLGSGDGRIVIAAAKKAGVRAYGYEIDPEMVDKSIQNVKEAGVEDLVTIEEKDIFELDLSEASVITLYLLPDLNVRLIPQLEKLKPGSRIVSHEFNMAGVEPDVKATVRREGGGQSTVYLWTTPLRKTN
ncbi:methyltransferase domain-containing protein [Chitinispirillales bacterium ANBcel5]|uniref:SAM-dependent methyltransferase n=1 Tax=Cellulosispirillum alkaliphilum TaxID=3039283 RepID=UPI002A59409A|nr:methyltransferase domain-containing protein [Chitinispirillales bacterium ANBcel5]